MTLSRTSFPAPPVAQAELAGQGQSIPASSKWPAPRTSWSTALATTLHADTAGGIVQAEQPLSLVPCPRAPNKPRWRSMVRPRWSSTGVDLSKARVPRVPGSFGQSPHRSGLSPRLRPCSISRGMANEDALTHWRRTVSASTPPFRGGAYDGVNLLDTEREPQTGIFNAEVDDDRNPLGSCRTTVFSPSGPVINPPIAL